MKVELRLSKEQRRSVEHAPAATRDQLRAEMLAQLFKTATDGVMVVRPPTLTRKTATTWVAGYTPASPIAAPNVTTVFRYTAAPISNAQLDYAQSLVRDWERRRGLREEQREVLNSWAADRAADMTRRAAFDAVYKATANVTPPWHMVHLRMAALQQFHRRARRDAGLPYVGVVMDTPDIRRVATGQARLEYVIRYMMEHLGCVPTETEITAHEFVQSTEPEQPDKIDPYCNMRTTAAGLLVIDKIVSWVHQHATPIDVLLPFEQLMPIRERIAA